MSVPDTEDAPPPELLFKRRVGFRQALSDLWVARELILTLAQRDFLARYKQAALGVLWAVLTPLALMVVFSLFFQRVADIETEGVPYVLFSYLGLLPWTFFSTSMSRSHNSLVANRSLLNRVACPREVFPISSVLVATIDTAIATSALGVLFLTSGFAPRATSYWVPVLLVIQIGFAVAAALIMSSIVVHVRDVRHAVPIALQLGLFATPVAYGLDAVPGSLQGLYVAANPLGAVIDGYRRSVLLGRAPDAELTLIAALSTVVLMYAGYRLFKRLETGIADVA